MIAAFLQPKLLAATVVRGAQSGRVWLHGDRIVIGANGDADLRLVGPGLNANHLVLTRERKPSFWRYDRTLRRRSGWTYRLDDHPENAINGAPAARSGILLEGSTITLGGYTELRISQLPLDRTAPADVIRKQGSPFVPVEYVGAFNAAFAAALAAFLGWFMLTGFDDREESFVYERTIELWFDALWVRKDSPEDWFAREFASCKLADAGFAGAPVFSELVTRAALQAREGDSTAAASTLRSMDALINGECAAAKKIRCDIADLAGMVVSDWCREVSS